MTEASLAWGAAQRLQTSMVRILYYSTIQLSKINFFTFQAYVLIYTFKNEKQKT